MCRYEDYKMEISPIDGEDGGGFLVTFPDLPGCMSDGETIEEAIREARDAFSCWVDASKEWGREIPAPDSRGTSGRFVTRLPRSLHARLVARARQEGVSLNTLVATTLAEHM